MEDIYFYSVVIGGALMLIQVLLSMTGLLDGFDFDDLPDTDFDADFDMAESSWGSHLVGVLSFRAILTGVTVFGLVGIAASKQFPGSDIQNFMIAVACGLGVLYLVGWLIQALYQLKYDGTVNIQRAIGTQGTVYLKIPGKNSGKGKVSIPLQERMMEYEAMTADDEIVTGTTIVVTGVLSPGVLEVKSVEAIAPPTSEELSL
ncbi:hypothetical protein Pla110_22670 [Polystyrenella longa]|uniref:NfeD-like C-terminal domain-containing protein n=1 Tax=Polystyrenella longa TaxID=2528007 RepID=A0A518CMS8_9PLAN|nr:hypothetical protein [Polystyrenella longa]QDU80536.1 hypothetical protein Pla110_22670 [Polystyrenella longa]